MNFCNLTSQRAIFRTSAEYNYQDAFRNLVCNVSRSNPEVQRFARLKVACAHSLECAGEQTEWGRILMNVSNFTSI